MTTLKVRELREKAGMSQDALARAAGISGSAVYRIEKRAALADGRTANVETLVKIAKALGVSLDALVA